MRRVRLTERDLSRIVKRVIKETKSRSRVDDFYDTLTSIKKRIQLAKDCEELDNLQDTLAHLENFLHHDKELTDDETEFMAELINEYYDLVTSKLQQCYEDYDY